MTDAITSSTVLVVDDDPAAADALADILGDEGYRVESAANGAQALAYLERGGRPCVIVLDLMMPVMDGWEFRRRQLQHPSLRTLPVIVTSAVEPGGGDELQGVAVVRKPIAFDALLSGIRQHCTPGCGAGA